VIVLRELWLVAERPHRGCDLSGLTFSPPHGLRRPCLPSLSRETLMAHRRL
jgi:hypothetical protein